jgi:hypothetical protein
VRAAPTTLGLLAAAGLAAQAAGALELEVVPSWQGWSRPGRTTEVELRLAGTGDVSVTIGAGGQRITSTVSIDAGHPARLRVPVPAASVVTVDAAPATGPAVREQVALSLAEAPLLAWVGAEVGARGPVGFQRLPLDSAALPGTVAGYGSIDALVIDAAALAALDDDQWNALLGHVASCGRTVLVGAATEAARLFASATGCSGRAIGFAADGDAAATRLDELLHQSLPEPVDARSLASMADADLAPWHRVVGTLAACAALLLLGAVFLPALAVQVALAVAAAIGASWFVQSRPADAQLVIWAEAGPGDRLARYQALQQTSLVQRGDVAVTLPAELATPRACRDLPDATWHWSTSERRFESLTVASRLFGRVPVCFAGHFPVARAAQSRDLDAVSITVRNSGPSSWPAGTLAWRRLLLPLPAVAPGEEFVATRAATTQPPTAAGRLALARTAPDAATMLWPLDVGLVKQAPERSQAWLLVTADAWVAGDPP